MKKLLIFFVFFISILGQNSVSVENERASRPDAPSVKESDAVVGPNTSIDLAPLLSCCKEALKRIGSVDESSCCDTVLGILGDACEILGPDRTISDKLRELVDGFSNISSTEMIVLNFNEVFTALDGLEELLCDKFEGVFSLLETTITENEENFNGIYTSLNRICEKIESLGDSLMVEIDFSAVFTALSGVEERLCNKFEGAFSALDDILETKEDGFEGTFTVLDTICEKIESITGTLLAVLDFNGIFTALNDVEIVLCDKFEGVFTVLAAEALCLPTPLTQDDVVNGDILLNIDGINYCMAENITATIVITGNNVNLDMNDRVLFGVININADDVIVENGKVQPFGPLTNDTNDPAITIGSENTVLHDLLIVCDDTITFQVAGRIGIMNGGNKTRIRNCSIKSGGGGPGTAIFFRAPDGGNGIINTGDGLFITDCIIETGFGGQQLTDGFGGTGGIGILNISGDPVIIQDSFILTGSGGVAISPGSSASGGFGGAGIEAQAGTFVIKNCTIVSGEGAIGDESSGFGGDGINFLNLVGSAVIDNCVLETGSGLVAGSGITYDGNSLIKVIRTSIVTGEPNLEGGYGLLSTSSCTVLSDITIKTLSGDIGSVTGMGIILFGSATIEDVVIATGDAGTNDVFPFDSGHGILVVNTDNVTIRNCTITTGNGGNNTSLAGMGGNAGHCIQVIGASNIFVDTCLLTSGTGGIGVAGNGVGGDGIFVTDSEGITIVNSVSNSAGASGFQVDSSSAICINNSKAIESAENGFEILNTTSGFTICNSIALGCNGNGFFLDASVTDGQVVSNKAESNLSGGIINDSGDIARHQIWNNIATNNTGIGNYFGVALVIAAPTVNTGFYSNVVM